MPEPGLVPARFRQEWEEGVSADVIARGHGLTLKQVYNMRVSLGCDAREPVPYEDEDWVEEERERAREARA